MSFATAQVTSNAAPTTVLLTALEDLLTAHSAWTFVKEYTSGSYTMRTWVNSGTENAWGQDFYITFRRTTSSLDTSPLTPLLHEGFNPASDNFIRGVPNVGSTLTPEATFSSAYGATEYSSSHSNWESSYNNLTNTLNFTYWLVVTVNGIFIKTSLDSFGTYVGLFQPFWTHPQEFPLVMMEIGNTDVDGAGGVTRRPSVSSSMADAFAVECNIDVAHCYTPPMGSVPSSRPLFDNECVGSRFLIRHTNVTNGEYRGLMYDCLIFLQDANIARGDTMDVEGESYVCLDDAGTYGLWVNTEAA